MTRLADDLPGSGPLRRAAVAVAVVCLGGVLSGAAGAQGLPGPTLPTLALQPAPAPSLWHGLTVGTELVAVAGRHGGVGGDVFAGYDHEFADNVVLGIRGATGSIPSLGGRAIGRGYDFAETEVKVGYDMGRLMPYVTAGVALARPHLGADLGLPGSGDSLNLVLNGAGRTQALTSVGAGVDYALTNDLTVGIAVRSVQGREPLLP